MDWQYIFNFLVMALLTLQSTMIRDLRNQLKKLDTQVDGIIAIMQKEE